MNQAIVTIRNKQWDVGVAAAPWELAEGLGGLASIPAGTGMLFDLGFAQTIQVTTVPMLFPLDIAFLSDTLVITEVYRNIQPGYLVTSSLPARYFLEVNAGELEGTDSGDRASVELLPPSGAMAVSDWTSAMAGFMGFMVMGILMVSIVRDLVKGMLREPEKKPELLPQTEVRFKPGEIVRYKGEKVKVLEHIGDRVSIWIPSRQEEVWVKAERLEKLEFPTQTIPDFLMATEEVMEYRVEENKPYGTWAIVELFPGGTVRSPFSTKEEAIKREEEIGAYYGWKLKRVEPTPDEIALLDPQRFPKRTEALHKLKGYDVIHVHDDGDLTVRSRGKFFVVTTDGQTFQQKEYLAQALGGTCYEDAGRFLIKEGEGELVHGTVQTIGRSISHAWVETETGYIWEPESGEFMKKDYFYSRAQPKVEARYTAEEAAIMMARTKNFGPWTEEEKRQILEKQPPATIAEQSRSRYKVGDRVKSKVWTDAGGGHPWLTVKGIYPTKWMGKPVVELEVTDGIRTNRVFEDTIIAHESTTPAKVVPEEKEPRHRAPGELEYFADSPEYLTQTIDAIGYRDRIDTVFQEAIARAKGLR